MPNLDTLSSEYGRGGVGGTGQGGDAGTGGTDKGGRANQGGSGAQGGDAGSGVGGTAGTAAGTGGESGANDGGQSGANDGGEGAVPQAGSGGSAGTSPGAGTGGTAGTSMGGMPATGGTMSEAGAGGQGPDIPCEDGCVLIYVPSAVNFSQFFTINLDLSAGVDLSNAVVTAHVRALDFTGTTENVQLYASALPNFNFFNNNNLTVPLSSMTAGATLTMDLTSTGGWDNTKVISIGFLLHGASSPSPVQLLVEDIQVDVKLDPDATANAGPWLFTQSADVNPTAAESVPSSFAESNIIFANPYNPVVGAKPTWIPPGGGGAGGSP